eukprot:561716-Pyramimonas_sp.AAC.1
MLGGSLRRKVLSLLTNTSSSKIPTFFNFFYSGRGALGEIGISDDMLKSSRVPTMLRDPGGKSRI